MKEFDLAKALNGAPIVTRDGIPASIVGVNYDIHTGTDIIVSFKDYDGIQTIPYDTEGKAKNELYEEDYDLFMSSTKVERWVNVYRSGLANNEKPYPGATLYTDKDAAIAAVTNDGTDLRYIATAKVTWEE